MYIKQAVWAALLGAGVANADFYVYTEAPIPSSAVPSFTNPSDASSWTFSVGFNAMQAYGTFESARGSTYQSSVDSVRSQVKDFVASAKNYSVPADVTNDDTTVSFIATTPNWYTALPSDVKSFKESQVQDQLSIVKSVINRHATTAGSSGAGVMPTPRAGLGAGFGAMAAVAAGVFL